MPQALHGQPSPARNVFILQRRRGGVGKSLFLFNYWPDLCHQGCSSTWELNGPSIKTQRARTSLLTVLINELPTHESLSLEWVSDHWASAIRGPLQDYGSFIGHSRTGLGLCGEKRDWSGTRKLRGDQCLLVLLCFYLLWLLWLPRSGGEAKQNKE